MSSVDHHVKASLSLSSSSSSLASLLLSSSLSSPAADTFNSNDVDNDDMKKNTKSNDYNNVEEKEDYVMSDADVTADTSYGTDPAALRGATCGRVGLVNLGNTCFMNAAIQAISHCKAFSQHFVDMPHTYLPSAPGDFRMKLRGDFSSSSQKGLGLTDVMTKLMKDLWISHSDHPIKPTMLLRLSQRGRMNFWGYGQQDSQEWLNWLLEMLDSELSSQIVYNNELQNGYDNDDEKDYYCNETNGVGHTESSRGSKYANARPLMNTTTQTTRDPPLESLVTRVFGGATISELVGGYPCVHRSTKFDSFTMLTLPLPNDEPSSYFNGKFAGSKDRQRGDKAEEECEEDDVNDDRMADIFSYGSADNTTGWVESMINGLSSWWNWGLGWDSYTFLPKRKYTLDECLASFFESEKLSGSEYWECDECKTKVEATKTLSLAELPQVLVILLKRYSHDHGDHGSHKLSQPVQFPTSNLDISPYINDNHNSSVKSSYMLRAVIHHRGGLGGGHYICYARHCMDGEWYEFNDSRVRLVSESIVAEVEAYMLFYERYSSQATEVLLSFKEETMALRTAEPHVFITEFWVSLFNLCANPGPINTYAFFCSHGQLHPHVNPDIARQSFRCIPESIFWRLSSTYGGGPAVRCTDSALENCQICGAAAQAALLARKQEYDEIRTIYNCISEIPPSDRRIAGCQPWFIVSSSWMHKWLIFLRSTDARDMPPGPIDNSNLLSAAVEDGSLRLPRHHLTLDTDYNILEGVLWDAVYSRYGGDTILCRDTPDMYGPDVELPIPGQCRDRYDAYIKLRSEHTVVDAAEGSVRSLSTDSERYNEITLDSGEIEENYNESCMIEDDFKDQEHWQCRDTYIKHDSDQCIVTGAEDSAKLSISEDAKSCNEICEDLCMFEDDSRDQDQQDINETSVYSCQSLDSSPLST